MPDPAVRIMLFSLPRLVSDLLHAAARSRRDVVLIEPAVPGGADLAGVAVATSADVVITSTEADGWPTDCATLVVERRPLAIYALDSAAGGACTLESLALGQLSPGELLGSAVARARSAR